jgi:exodeoxyribonuclease VII small subunit
MASEDTADSGDSEDVQTLPVDLTYSEAIDELAGILDELEGDEIDIDRLASEVRRAAALIRFCRGRIDDARVEVEQIVTELEADQTAGNGPG